MAKDSNSVIICAALTGAATMKNNNPSVPYTIQEFAEEANKCCKAGAAMVHVHARMDDGQPTHEIDRIQAVYDAIKQKSPDLLVCLSSAVGIFKTAGTAPGPDRRRQAGNGLFNTNSMNFSIIDRKTGMIFFDYVFDNTFTMLQDFGKAFEENSVKPEIECYDISGIDNTMHHRQAGVLHPADEFQLRLGRHRRPAVPAGDDDRHEKRPAARSRISQPAPSASSSSPPT